MAGIEETKDEEYREAINKIADSYKTLNIMKRGVINGIFTAIGATVGFTVFIFLLARFYSGLQNVPIIENFMEVTQLNKVVEYVLQETNQDTSVSETIDGEEANQQNNNSTESE